jgi:hypothetical protein
MILENESDHSLRYNDGHRVRALVGPEVDADGKSPALITVDSVLTDLAAAGTVTLSDVILTGDVTTDTLTVDAAATFEGAVTTVALQLPSTAGPTTGALTAAMSGRLCLGDETADYDLPAAAGNAGVWYTIVTANPSASAGLTITATAAVIQGKTDAAGATAITNATVLTNTHTSDVVGDYVTLLCDGTNWWVIGQSGTYAGS